MRGEEDLDKAMTMKGLVVLITEGTGRFPELSRAFEGAGYGVEQCAPFEAVRFAWQRPIDLGILDLSVAGADWPELCQALKECPNPVKLLALTHHGAPSLDGLPSVHRPEAKVAADEPADVILGVVARILGIAVDMEPWADFPALLADLWRERATGLLAIQGEVHTAVYFRAGTPIFAELGALSDTLGRILVRQGKLSEDEFSLAIQRMTDSLVENEQIRLGEVLIEMGLLTGEEIHEALRLQTREKLLRCFLWRRLRSDFQAGEEHLEGIEPFPCEVPALLLEGIRRYYDHHRVAGVLEPIRGQHPILTVAPAVAAKEFEVDIVGLRMLQSLTGEQSVAQLWEKSDLDPIIAGQILAALVVADAVTLVAPAEPVPVVPAAPVETAPSPAAATAPPSGPTGLPDITASLQPSTPQELARVTPTKKKRPKTQPLQATGQKDRQESSKLERLNAEGAFRQAKRYQSQNALDEALVYYGRAAELQPDAVEYAMHVAFMELLLATKEEAKLDAARRAARLARALLAQDETTAEAFAVLGHARLAEGKNKAAAKSFKRAAELDPTDIASARQARLLHMRGFGKG